MEAIRIRQANAEDLPFIFANWLRSYRAESYFAKRMRTGVFYKWHPKIVNATVSRPGTRALIAHPEGEPNVFLGFVVYELKDGAPLLHFIYIKEQFRRSFGVFGALWKESGLDLDRLTFTHWTRDWDRFANQPSRTGEHNPETRIYDPYQA